MKTLKKQIKSITWLFAIVMLFQSCTVYKSKPVTLNEAVQNESKVKVKPVNGEDAKFKKIIFEDKVYYGINKHNRNMVKFPLDENNISIIKEKNKTLSKILSIGIPVVIVGGILAIAAASCCSFGGSFYIPSY